MPSTGNGNAPRRSTRAANTHFWALFRTALVSVQPVKTSVAVRVWANSPRGSPPSWPTRSISTNPGRLLVPLRPGPDRDLRLQQRTMFGARAALELQALAFTGQPAVDRGCRQCAQLRGGRVRDVQLVKGPQPAHDLRQERRHRPCPPGRPSPPTPCAAPPSRPRRRLGHCLALAHRQSHVRGWPDPNGPYSPPRRRRAFLGEATIPVTRASLVSQLGPPGDSCQDARVAGFVDS